MKIYKLIYDLELEENTINGGGFLGYTAPVGLKVIAKKPKKKKKKKVYEFYDVEPLGGGPGSNLNYGIMGGTLDGLNLGSPTLNGHRFSMTGDRYNLDSNLPTSEQPGANDREDYENGGYSTRLYYLIDVNDGSPVRQASRQEWERSKESEFLGNQGIIKVEEKGKTFFCYVVGEES
jgi:hypothetical protein